MLHVCMLTMHDAVRVFVPYVIEVMPHVSEHADHWPVSHLYVVHGGAVGQSVVVLAQPPRHMLPATICRSGS